MDGALDILVSTFFRSSLTDAIFMISSNDLDRWAEETADPEKGALSHSEPTWPESIIPTEHVCH
jgi:hypothetical protein